MTNHGCTRGGSLTARQSINESVTLDYAVQECIASSFELKSTIPKNMSGSNGERQKGVPVLASPQPGGYRRPCRIRTHKTRPLPQIVLINYEGWFDPMRPRSRPDERIINGSIFISRNLWISRKINVFSENCESRFLDRVRQKISWRLLTTWFFEILASDYFSAICFRRNLRKVLFSRKLKSLWKNCPVREIPHKHYEKYTWNSRLATRVHLCSKDFCTLFSRDVIGKRYHDMVRMW